MMKLLGVGLIGSLAIGALLLFANQALDTIGQDPLGKDVQGVANRVPAATANGLKETTDAISANPTTDQIASQSPTYRGTKTTVDTTSTIVQVLTFTLAAVKLIAKIFLVLCAIALVTRTVSRRRRQYVTYEIRTHREAIVSTEQIRAFMSSATNLIYVRSRRFQRFFTGSPSLAFRVLAVPNTQRGDSEVASYITVPSGESLNRLIRKKFSDNYQDAELKRIPNDRWPTIGYEIVRNKKTRKIPFTIKVPGISTASESFEEGFNAPVMDKVVTAMSSSPMPAEVQLVATPVPRPFDTFIRFLSGIQTRSSQKADAIERSEGENTAKASANEGHLFVEMRVGSPDYEFTRDIAAVLQGAAGGDAQLRERRPVLRKKLYRTRFQRGVGNPLPSWLFSVYSTSELASLWQLPSAQLRSITTKRINRRRVSVPPEVHYVDNETSPSRSDVSVADLAMWLSPERKEIALLPEDFLFGVGVAGQQGMGKTVLMARMISALLSEDQRFAGLVCDPKGDLAESVLAFLPPNRRVHYIDFDDPQIGIDPFLISDMRDEAAVVNVVLHGIIDVARTEEDESQILASSRDFLTMALYATLATTVPFGIKPTFFHLRKWISSDPRNVEWRQKLLTTVIATRPSREFIVDGYEEYHSALERSEAQFTTRAAAPMNKVSELLTEAIDRVLRHDLALNFEEAVRNRDVIIVNGRNHKSADMIFRFLWQMADQTLGRLEAARNKAIHRIDLGEEIEVPDQVKFLFGVDEAPSIVTPTTAEIMARRRSAGLHMMIGWQHDAQIRNPAVRSALYSLLHNVFQFRTGVEDARQRVDLFQMTYDDQQDSRLREIRTNRVSVADLTYLDRYNFYAFQLVRGNRVPAYWGWTIDPAGRASYGPQHLARQKAAGGHSMGPLSPPDYKEEAEIAVQRMSFDPPSFSDPKDDHEARAAAIPDPGIDFDAVLRINDDADGSADNLRPETMDPSGSDSAPSDSTASRADHDAGVSTAPAPEPRVPPATTPTGYDNGRVGSNGKFTTGKPEESALDDSLSIDRQDIVHDMPSATNGLAGPGEDKAPVSPKAAAGSVGPLGQHLPGEIGSWLEAVDVLREVRSDGAIKFVEPPADATPGSVQARNEKAKRLAADSKIIQPDIQAVLHWLYEFNVMSQTQMVYATGLSRSTLTRRINGLLSEGVLRGLQLGKHKVWTLTDLGTRVGRRINNRYGPLIPYEPGKSPDGKYEAARQWGPRNVSNAHSVIHDLHTVSWVMRFVELCDGDFRYTVNAGEGIIQKVTGEFGAIVDPPMKGNRRRREPVNLYGLPALLDGIAFRGVDAGDGSIGKVHPDAAIRLHNLTNEQKTSRREIWVEMDRQGHPGHLEEKLQNYDVFQALWWRTVPRFRSAGRPPVVVFIAPSTEILKKQIAIADRVLLAQAGRRRDGPEKWGPPASRNRIFFALEADLHKGSTRMYRVPEATPAERHATASNDRERAEAANCHPRLEDRLLPQRLMAGRRASTHEPPLRRND
ncbi:MAG: hypothetical protein J0H98_07135 [Solirubrobacterales bacterium]|nr:hypothetical protein [Solirubrobacterales bacterium]